MEQLAPAGCDCLSRVNAELKARNTKLSISFVLTSDLNGMDCLPLVATEKLDTKLRGRVMAVIPTFCPFCGAKYPRDGAEAQGLRSPSTAEEST